MIKKIKINRSPKPSCDRKLAGESDAQWRKRCGPRPLGSIGMGESTTRSSKKGAPGTLKAKIKGPVTIAKAKALKNRKNATPHDKAQANWFINMQRGKKKTNEALDLIRGNLCIECGYPVHEDLKKWFKQKWVNIGKKDKSGKHTECGTSGEKRGYAKCVPASKAAGMSKKEKASATRRKRAAQNKAGRGGRGKPGTGSQGKKPIKVSTDG